MKTKFTTFTEFRKDFIRDAIYDHAKEELSVVNRNSGFKVNQKMGISEFLNRLQVTQEKNTQQGIDWEVKKDGITYVQFEK